jgi:hypothetical protein
MAEKRIDSKVLKVIRYFTERLKETGADVTCVVVFGSHIKGSAREDSDIDMIVVSKDFRKKSISQRAEIVRNAYADTIKEFMMPIDLVMETPEEFNPDFGMVVYAA